MYSFEGMRDERTRRTFRRPEEPYRSREIQSQATCCSPGESGVERVGLLLLLRAVVIFGRHARAGT